MRWHFAKALFWATRSGLLLCIALGAVDAAFAQTTQTTPTQPTVIYVQPARGATPASTIINAEANYMESYGQLLQSAATARKINAEAVALEIDNWKNSIKARDEMLDLYWDRWRKDHPNYLTRQGTLREIMQKLVEGQDQGLLRGDLSVPLNWLLYELSGPVMANRYLADNQTMVNSRLDLKLAPRDLEKVRLSDGGSKASRLVFSAAGDDNPLQPHWPLALRSSEFDALRKNYEQTVQQIVTEIKEKHALNGAAQEKVMQDINAILVALEDAYPREQRVDSTKYSNYLAAKRFLRAALASTTRAITAPDAFVLSGGLRFHGDSVVGLLQHMYERGLEFASAEPGGEGTCKRLFEGMRVLYVEYRSNQPSADRQKNLPVK
jgi:hypothetical protein